MYEPKPNRPYSKNTTNCRNQKPEWLRLPPSGFACPHTGLKRSKLNELILPSALNNFSPPVKSICLRNKGQKKGVRLISFDSLMEYLQSFEKEQLKSITTEDKQS